LRPQSATWTVRPSVPLTAGGLLAERLLTVVDLGLLATICSAPFVFGGRHDLGRLVFVALVAVTSIAWFARQCLLPAATWTRSAAFGILLLAGALVALQLAPLPADWIAHMSPRTAELLPLWTGGEAGVQLGPWKTLSLTPRETTLALAMLVSYGLLFTVLTQRIQTTADVERLLNSIGIAAAVMAAFGLVQFFFSNGQFFWCYVHPYRTTDRHAMGSFMNRNHFAGFLVLGVGPLVRWLVSVVRAEAVMAKRRRTHATLASMIKPALLLAAIATVLMGIALSFSRGGALALAAATVTIGGVYWRWRLVDGKYLYGFAGIVLLMLGLLSIYGYDELSGRLDDFTAGSIESLDQSEGRRKVWQANVEAIRAGGLVGSGAGSHVEICPLYLSEPTQKEFTHAENGYLQVVTENGILGGLLLAVGIALVGSWSVVCFARLRDPAQQLCCGAAVAGLVASLVHSLVDFVWYIPACMSLTVALAVCVLRLGQLASVAATAPPRSTAFVWTRPRWMESGTLVTMLAIWTVNVFVGPGVAAVHWDRYLRDQVGGARMFGERLSQLDEDELTASELAMRRPLADSMRRHLEDTLRWDPSFARAHLKLAARYVDAFETAQQNAANAMGLQQICEGAQSSTFASQQELREWLGRAVGANAELLFKAHEHARQAVMLEPLEGEGYVFLANLSFINGEKSAATDAYIAQAKRVRPHQGDVLFEVGKQLYAHGRYDEGMAIWARCFAHPGSHQLRIISLLTKMPARDFLEAMQPDWRTLREVWACYRQGKQQQDLADMVTYAAQITQRDLSKANGIPPVYVWLWQASMYGDLQQREQELACLEHAYRSDPHVFRVRQRLGFALKDAERYSEAEPHLRWCLARRPENKDLNGALTEITKQRHSPQKVASVQAMAGDAILRR
jgi:O-antigen ligase/tetratricopeptide (TPR) repeat protein